MELIKCGEDIYIYIDVGRTHDCLLIVVEIRIPTNAHDHLENASVRQSSPTKINPRWMFWEDIWITFCGQICWNTNSFYNYVFLKQRWWLLKLKAKNTVINFVKATRKKTCRDSKHLWSTSISFDHWSTNMPRFNR